MISKKRALIYSIILVIVTIICTSMFQITLGNKVIISKNLYELYSKYDKLLGLENVIESEYYQKVSEEIIKKLDEGKNVAYLTLGDPTVYSTYIYIQRIVKKCGYDAEIINGVPSFCAVAAKLGDSLADRSEQLHIIPSNYDIKEALKLPGNKILMKAASKLSDVKKVLKEQGQKAWMIENCGMEEEKIYHSVEEMPEKATYYTTLLVKEEIDKNS